MTDSKTPQQPGNSAAKLVLNQLEEACAALSPGDAFPSYREWMKRLGASERAVRSALEELQRQGKIAREQGRGTFVLEIAAKKSTGIVGISGAQFSADARAYWNPFLEGVQRVANGNDIQLMLLNYRSDIDWDKMDGMIIHRTNLPYSQEVLRTLPPTMPAIAALVAVPEMPSVVVDDYQGSRALAEHLVGLGHRRIAYMYDHRSKLRLLAYHDALEAAGIVFEDEWLCPFYLGDESYAQRGHDSMQEWLQGRWQETGCTALLTQNDDTAIGAIRALREAGISVPDEVSVTGFDDTEIGRYFSPAITTVSVPLEQIGATAMELLLRQIRGEKVAVSQTMLPTALSARDSTQSPCSRSLDLPQSQLAQSVHG